MWKIVMHHNYIMCRIEVSSELCCVVIREGSKPSTYTVAVGGANLIWGRGMPTPNVATFKICMSKQNNWDP